MERTEPGISRPGGAEYFGCFDWREEDAHRAPSLSDDYSIEQHWDSYAPEEHAMWRTLFARQSRILRGRAFDGFLAGIEKLGVAADGLPDFRRLNEVLERATGWSIVAVPGLVPDDVFFGHLANRRFPSTCFIRRPEQIDYLQEPDIFHDVFGHVPLLIDPVFADFMQRYGEHGLAAARSHRLEMLARLYWYTVEFGLIATGDGLRIYGSGIVSSYGESRYCLEDPGVLRIAFRRERVMRTTFRIDSFQLNYFVIRDFRELFDALDNDLEALCDELADLPSIAHGRQAPGDKLISRSP